jgi:putative PIN family toxin of toxin-antitoxin system
MTRATIDTNTLASGVIAKKPSPSFRIYQAVLSGQVILVTTGSLLEELEDVLNRDYMVKAHQLSTATVHELVGLLAQLSAVIPIESVSPITGDPDDDYLLAGAYAGQADYIVSGDKRHVLPLKQFHGIPIVSPARFVKEVLSGTE